VDVSPLDLLQPRKLLEKVSHENCWKKCHSEKINPSKKNFKKKFKKISKKLDPQITFVIYEIPCPLGANTSKFVRWKKEL
jgi:hypothetical protein